jgi:hypothetical protein
MASRVWQSDRTSRAIGFKSGAEESLLGATLEFPI